MLEVAIMVVALGASDPDPDFHSAYRLRRCPLVVSELSERQRLIIAAWDDDRITDQSLVALLPGFGSRVLIACKETST